MGGTILQHGSILLGSQQEMLVGLQADGLELSQPSVGLSRVLGHTPSQKVLIRHLVRGMESQLGGVWRMGTRPPDEEYLAAVHEKEYRSWEWTWRR